ncbi:hypothetical protein TrLO_g9579 [Triparma laevis f. longispina]|uniref:Uncharacterized protein n=2 Tax=Triparma laevis TaxID=1534972 RepID=A0A9W6ZAT5_9STRA|nr:hypothetical protein TrLO_g9579 [Triparma laevis f. longispina]
MRVSLFTCIALLSPMLALAFTPQPSTRKLQKLKTSGSVSTPLAPSFTVANRGGALGAVPGWAAYTNALEEKPLITKAMTSLVGWALGDFLAQTFINKGPFDVARFLTLSAFGFIYHGPSGHYFYNWLDERIEGTGVKQVFSKVAIDQIFWCPIFMSVFFAYLGLVAGDSLPAIRTKISSDLLSACKGSWKVWPLVHAINFRFIPNKFRLFYINAVQIGFNIFLSIIGTK